MDKNPYLVELEILRDQLREELKRVETAIREFEPEKTWTTPELEPPPSHGHPMDGGRRSPAEHVKRRL